MKRLLWKEIRERWLWGAVWIVGIVVCVLKLHEVNLTHAAGNTGGLMLISAIVGAGAFSGEIAHERALFLYTRPVSWKKLLLSKVLFGLIVSVMATLLTVGLFQLAGAEHYVSLATWGSLLNASLVIVLVTFLSYLLGLSCSMVLPGLTGGAVVAVATVLIAVAYGKLLRSASIIPMRNDGPVLFLVIVGSVIAATLIARYGITLPTNLRAARFALILAISFVLMGAVGGVLAGKTVQSMISPKAWKPSVVAVSPDGKYAFTEWHPRGQGLTLRDDNEEKEILGITRLSDGRITRIDGGPDGHFVCWIDDSAMLFRRYLKPHLYVTTVVYFSDGRLKSSPVAQGIAYGGCVISPDGRTVMLIPEKWEQDSDRGAVSFVDRRTWKCVGPVLTGSTHRWWQTENQVGYLAPDGRTHAMEVRE